MKHVIFDNTVSNFYSDRRLLRDGNLSDKTKDKSTEKTNRSVSIVLITCILFAVVAFACACDYPRPVVFGDFELYVNPDGTYRIFSLLNKQATEVVIPDSYNDESITAIGQSAFRNCSNLVSVTIPDGVITIDHFAFANCSSLTSVTIGKDVAVIGTDAFSGCGKLTKIYYTGDVSGWCGIGGLFYLMSASRALYIGNEELAGEMAIPENVTEIKTDAFYNCAKLTSVTIPSAVTIIGNGAFSNCSSLTKIFFDGTVERWNAIQKFERWNYGVPATKVICSDGEAEL